LLLHRSRRRAVALRGSVAASKLLLLLRVLTVATAEAWLLRRIASSSTSWIASCSCRIAGSRSGIATSRWVAGSSRWIAGASRRIRRRAAASLGSRRVAGTTRRVAGACRWVAGSTRSRAGIARSSSAVVHFLIAARAGLGIATALRWWWITASSASS